MLILERVPASLRGELSRWMIEPRTGVFVGRVSGLVRDKLWELAQEKAGDGAGALLYSARTEQGFAVRSFGERARELVDWEGITLVRVPDRKRKRGKQAETGE